MYNNTIISKFQCKLQFKLQLFVPLQQFWKADLRYRNAVERQLEVVELRSGPFRLNIFTGCDYVCPDVPMSCTITDSFTGPASPLYTYSGGGIICDLCRRPVSVCLGVCHVPVFCRNE